MEIGGDEAARMRLASATLAAVFIVLAGLGAATQFLTSAFDAQTALGRPLFLVDAQPIHAPWSVLIWSVLWGELYPRPFAFAHLIIAASAMIALVPPALALKRRFTPKPFAKHAWANADDVANAGLFARSGAILGRFNGEMLAFDGPEHQLLIGQSRSGKGRSHVVPTLLATQHSCLVLDVKGELADGDPRHNFPGAAGFRETLGPVIRFAPTMQSSACFNPMFEIRKGANEVRGAQNLTDVIFAAYEDGPIQDFWRRSAANIAAPVLLHVLYAEPLHRKTLAVVREKLRTLAKTADEMRRTLHRLNPDTNKPEVHPEILHAAESFLAGEERMQSGIQATAESVFGVFADPLIARNTSTSDFRLSDLMCHDKPVTLYLQPPASDIARLMPLMRAIVDLTGRTLMEHQTEDPLGRQKRHRLILVLDEFPMLGRLCFFETMMGAMAGYGLKAYLVCQSLNHITRAYGRDNVIIDNCALVTSFSASDGDTAKRIAEMAGEVWEVRESETQRKPKPLLGWGAGSTTLREERRPLMLPADVRGLPKDEQLIFVSGSKPIRAKKLAFDQERIFLERLRPSTKVQIQLTTAHDWTDVKPWGFLEAAPKAPLQKSRAMAPPHATNHQGDLFGAPPGVKLSDLALAGFRNPDGSRIAPPPSPPTKDEEPSRKPKPTGI
jgi:type IV secretion system protein VirD4